MQAGWAEAHYALGTALLHRERYREAINAFDEALELRPSYPEAEFNRGNAYAMRGLADNGTMDYYELDCAVQAYKKAIQQRPGYPAALYNLGMVYKRMNSSEGLRVWDEYMEAARPAARGDDLVGAGAGVQGRPAGPAEVGPRGRRAPAHGPTRRGHSSSACEGLPR